uniref:Endosomal/lysosomal proton channel TMEM175 n=1 Tax=Callorhinchus milii TaxID=7868 RepID=A0A4W3HCA0_CALMI
MTWLVAGFGRGRQITGSGDSSQSTPVNPVSQSPKHWLGSFPLLVLLGRPKHDKLILHVKLCEVCWLNSISLSLADLRLILSRTKESLQQLLATKIAVYVMTFLIVTVAWTLHNACMMLITFLPYTFSLMASFPDDPLGILLFCVSAIVIGLIQAVIVIYGFSRPYLLNTQIQASQEQTLYKYQILKMILRAPAFFLLAAILSFIFCPVVSLLALVIFLPYITECLTWCKSKIREPRLQRVPFSNFHSNEPLSKERVEAFSDGVFAIVATLLILDICEDNVPDPKEVAKQFNGKLIEALSEYGPEFLAYFGSFVTVGLLWFVHHSLFLYITKPTRLMGLLNTLSLAFIGGLPLAFRLTHEFAAKSHNEREAIQISCVIIFLASIFQFAIWAVALYNEKETLHRHIQYGGKEHAFMFAKLSLYPSMSFVTFCLTYMLSRFSTEIFHLMQIIVPFAFVLLRIIVRFALAILKWLKVHPPNINTVMIPP